MKKYFLILLSISILTACKNENTSTGDVSPEMQALLDENEKLRQDVAQRDSTFNYYINSMAEIESNLYEIKKKEKMLAANAKGGEMDKTKEQQIVEDLAAIKDLLAKNRNTIASLSQKFKNSQLKIANLEETIANLEKAAEEKDGEIALLQDELSKTNKALSNLFEQYSSRSQELDETTNELNTVYWAFGTEKELKENKVVSKDGGFLGLGKNSKLSSSFNKNYFTKADLRELNGITLGFKKAKLITSHPEGSFNFVKDDKDDKIVRIDITNAKEFWSASKFLVVEVK